MTDELKFVLIVLAAWGGVCFTGGRLTAPAPPPAVVRYIPVHVPAPAPLAEAVPIEPAVEPTVVPTPVEPPAETPAPVEAKPLPAPRPKVEAPAKVQPRPARVRLPSVRKSRLPSCAVIKREFDRMTWAQRMARYAKEKQEGNWEAIAQGKRCLGM